MDSKDCARKTELLTKVADLLATASCLMLEEHNTMRSKTNINIEIESLIEEANCLRREARSIKCK
jgi:hypothetical protein